MHQDVLDGGSPQPLFPPAPGEELRGTGSQHMHHLVISTSSKGVSGVKPALVQWGSVDISEQLELEATTQEYEHKCASYLEEAVHVSVLQAFASCCGGTAVSVQRSRVCLFLLLLL